ncbi:exodeoxyribonuclease V, gamma subunit, partial [Vibrio parahaemolyticus V-223/04]
PSFGKCLRRCCQTCPSAVRLTKKR